MGAPSHPIAHNNNDNDSSANSSIRNKKMSTTAAAPAASTTTASASTSSKATSSFKKFLRRSNKSSNDSHSKPKNERRRGGVDGGPGADQPTRLSSSSSSSPPSSSLAATRSQRASSTKKGKRGGLLSSILSNKQNHKSNHHHSNNKQQLDDPLPVISLSHSTNHTAGTAKTTSPYHSLDNPGSGVTQPIHNGNGIAFVSAVETSANKRKDLFQWQDEMEEQEKRSLIQKKQLIKERDGFCRRVDSYDGQVIYVEGKAAYELGNYLGGGVAGVVYEGHRLQPIDEYPVRSGAYDRTNSSIQQQQHPKVVNTAEHQDDDQMTVESFLCMPSKVDTAGVIENTTIVNTSSFDNRDTSFLTMDSQSLADTNSLSWGNSPPRTQTQQKQQQQELTEEIALEATRSNDNMVIIDKVDAPSRSKHFAKAVSMNVAESEFQSDASFMGGGMMEETVAIKILNPVGFRTLAVTATQTAVVAREGELLEPNVVQGLQPMEERHVWWLVNPSSRNLRTLQRYNVDKGPRTVEVDRGSPEKGLRISLIAAYKDPKTQQLRELPLTRCIEIWGHVPFGASDAEFKEIMSAIDRVNQGQPPPPIPKFMNGVQGRTGTGNTSGTCSIRSDSFSYNADGTSLSSPTPMHSKRTGIYRAAYSERKVVFCQELNAYIAIPTAPSKYLKWLRQRRAATKEIRNMMRIGRHRNVVHLFEVLELIQENKSTMFLILELVRGGELFDLISSNAAKISKSDKIPDGFSESETVMRKFFRELASGINYCHQNGIAHRDLKPENLLVHNSRSGDCVLKIADFGLSAVFGDAEDGTDQETVGGSLISLDGSVSPPRQVSDITNPTSTSAQSPIKQQMDRIISASGNALAFLTCGAVDDILNCNPRTNADGEGPSPLRRMTSVVGSPHYVAPEIISQADNKRNKKDKNGEVPTPLPSSALKGYDGTKADVWSAGVILYAMLFRSLPFGEDLLRCPRFQSYRKWYAGVAKAGSSRRSNVLAALHPVITDTDERDFLGPHWFFPSSSSRESRDMIVYMLNPDPNMRPSIDLVLQHPWLLKQAKQ